MTIPQAGPGAVSGQQPTPASVAPQQQQRPVGDPNGAPYQPQQQQQTPVVPQAGQPVFVQDPNTGQFVQVTQPAPQPEPTPEQTPETVEVQAVNEARAQVEGFLKTAGIPASQVEQEVLALGSISEGTRKALVDKHGEATTNLIVNQINDIATQQRNADAALSKMQHDMVAEAFQGMTEQSGEQTWNELLGWCKTNIDLETRKSINAMMAAGGFQAKQAINHMVSVFKTANGVEQNGQLLNGNNLTGGGDNKELSASAYSRELDKIVAKHGYDSPERKALDSRRMATRQRQG